MKSSRSTHIVTVATPVPRIRCLRPPSSKVGGGLDCFDTVLPAIYAKSGFVAVARLKWNDDYAPDDWNYTTYSAFNGGRPDVVFMAHDPAALGSRYQRRSGRDVDSYDDGIDAVRARTRTAAASGSGILPRDVVNSPGTVAAQSGAPLRG